MAKQPSEKYPDDTKPGDDLKAHRRLLRFLNHARCPEDLLVAPHDRIFVDEEEAHSGGVDHHPVEKPILEKDVAKRLLAARDQISPLHGFLNIKDVVAVNERFGGLIPGILRRFGPANYGRWDLLYPLAPGGTPFAIEHAALLRTYKVVFLADGTDTATWDPSNETTPVMSRLTPATTGLTANLVCCGHSFLSDGRLLAVGGGGLGPGALTSIQGWKFESGD